MMSDDAQRREETDLREPEGMTTMALLMEQRVLIDTALVLLESEEQYAHLNLPRPTVALTRNLQWLKVVNRELDSRMSITFQP